MLRLPDFAHKTLDGAVCVPCKRIYRPADVTGVGLKSFGEGVIAFCFAVTCSKCHRADWLVVEEYPLFLADFICVLQEMIESDPDGEFADGPSLTRFKGPRSAKSSPRTKPKFQPRPRAETSTGNSVVKPSINPARVWTAFQSDLPPSGVVLRIKGFWRKNTIAAITVLGGFRQQECGTVIFLVRPEKENVQPHDTEFRLAANRTVELGGYNEQRLTVPDDWDRFKALRAGDLFKLAEKVWQKMSEQELREVVGTGVWTTVSGVNDPKKKP